jgi:hypothetical protein
VAPTDTPVTQTPATPTNTIAADFTEPGEGLAMIRRLIDAAGSSKVIMVQVNSTEATVAVVQGTQVQAWGYRAGAIKQVPTDIEYLDQAIFDINDFNLTDIGALFRTAASISGSDAQQSLQIVDYSAGDVLMAVSTNPESRTVFFRPDGSVVSTLDFWTRSGIEEGLKDAIGPKRQVIRVGVIADSGAYIDYVGPNDTTVRRLRPSRFPASTSAKSDTPSLPEFDPDVVDPDVIWSVLSELRQSGDFTGATPWSVTVEDADPQDGGTEQKTTATPRMYFTVGGKRFITDLEGERLG